MIVLNDSTARRIANCLKSMGAGTLEKAGELDVSGLIQVLEKPLPEGYGACVSCKHEKTHAREQPCADCVRSMSFSVASGWEAKQ